MSFEKDLEWFSENHHYDIREINGIPTRYLLCGNENAEKTLVYLVGGTGISDVWFNHIHAMEKDFRILTLDYPMEIWRLEELADHIIKLLNGLGIERPILIGASLGGFVAQVIARKYASEIGAVILYSTCSLSEGSISDLKKQYKSYGIILKLMKVIPYSWIKGLLISVSKKQVGLENENPIDQQYMEDFFTWIYGNYTKEFDIHMTSLIIDVAMLDPFDTAVYASFDYKSLLILPEDDKAFSKAAQEDLLQSMPRAKVVTVSGGHTSTLYKVEDYVRKTKDFIVKNIG